MKDLFFKLKKEVYQILTDIIVLENDEGKNFIKVIAVNLETRKTNLFDTDDIYEVYENKYAVEFEIENEKRKEALQVNVDIKNKKVNLNIENNEPKEIK